ncbi:phage tail domain-containing protein [Streptomyces decoyicus]
MPIPATRDQVQQDRPDPVPIPPLPMRWGHTYVSITGSNGEGEEIPLTAFNSVKWPAIFIQPGATGLDKAPIELHSDDSPNLDGGIFRSTRAVQREVMIPVYIYGIDRRTLKELKRQLIQQINPRNGYCVIKFVEADSQPRYLYAYYKDGLQGSESEDQAGFKWIKYGLQFTAFDPYYYSDEIRVAEWTFGTEAKPFNPPSTPLLPVKLNRGGLANDSIPVVNPGDVEAWPRWELAGPIESFEITSPSGDSFGIQSGTSYAVDAGRTLTIDTRPGYKTLKDDQGRNYWQDLRPSPVLWPIKEGRSTVSVSIVAGAGQAALRLILHPRYETY